MILKIRILPVSNKENVEEYQTNIQNGNRFGKSPPRSRLHWTEHNCGSLVAGVFSGISLVEAVLETVTPCWGLNGDATEAAKGKFHVPFTISYSCILAMKKICSTPGVFFLSLCSSSTHFWQSLTSCQLSKECPFPLLKTENKSYYSNWFNKFLKMGSIWYICTKNFFVPVKITNSYLGSVSFGAWSLLFSSLMCPWRRIFLASPLLHSPSKVGKELATLEEWMRSRAQHPRLIFMSHLAFTTSSFSSPS